MTLYYKATNPAGRDFRTDTIDYAAALQTGQLVRHPGSTTMVPNQAATYLSVSVEKAETLLGGRWPCRLFRVEPGGEPLGDLTIRHKRACLTLRVVEELPAWEALGPNGQVVAAVVDRVSRLTLDEVQRLAATWDAARDAAWDVARDVARDAAWGAARAAAWAAARGAAWDAAWGAAWGAAWAAARGAAWDAAWGAAWDVARDAAWGELVRDLITTDQYQALAGPWNSAIGTTAVTP